MATPTASTPEPSAAPPPPEPTLVQLFEESRLQEAVDVLRQWDSAKVQMEITLAFSCVSRAPSFFLECIDLYRKLPGKQLSDTIQWIESAVACIKSSQDPKISHEDSSLAGEMLPAFQRPRMPFVAHFALAYRVDTETLRAFCANLFKIKVGLAVHFMDCLKMKHLLPPPMVLEAVIKYKDFRAGDVFAKGDQDTQQEFIRMLINCNVQDKVIKKRLSLFKLQASEFPVYFERRKKATLRFLVYSSEFEQALEFVDGSEDLKLYACKMIIRHAGPNDPATKQFVFRSGLARYFPEIDISEEADKSFDDKEDLEPLGSCLSIIDAIGEANIIFVDTPVSLEACVAYLNTQPVIGFDSEWKAVHISTGPVNVPAQCSLLQLASREKAFVVDAIALYDNGNILAPIFQSPSIVKIGFDTKGDVKALRPFLTGGYASEHVMSMLVDLQSVTRKLPTPTSATQLLNVEGDKVNAAELIVNTEVASSGGETAVDGEKNDEVPLPTTKPRKWKKKRSKISKSDGGMKASRLGLTAVAEAYLGLPLDKRARMSDWERRPLTQAQLHYAALDAQVLVQIYYKMQELHPVDTFEAVVRKCTQSHIR